MREEPIQICVCGWHYRHDFDESLLSVSDRFDITVVANRGGNTNGLPTLEHENVGLECVTDGFWRDVERIAYDQAFICRDVSE